MGGGGGGVIYSKEVVTYRDPLVMIAYSLGVILLITGIQAENPKVMKH